MGIAATSPPGPHGGGAPRSVNRDTADTTRSEPPPCRPAFCRGGLYYHHRRHHHNQVLVVAVAGESNCLISVPSCSTRTGNHNGRRGGSATRLTGRFRRSESGDLGRTAGGTQASTMQCDLFSSPIPLSWLACVSAGRVCMRRQPFPGQAPLPPPATYFISGQPVYLSGDDGSCSLGLWETWWGGAARVAAGHVVQHNERGGRGKMGLSGFGYPCQGGFATRRTSSVAAVIGRPVV